MSKEGPSAVLFDFDSDFDLVLKRLETSMVAVFWIFNLDLLSKDPFDFA